MNLTPLEKDFLSKIKEHQNIIHKICFVYCRRKNDREDLYQEVVLQLWKSFPSFKGQSTFSTWMYRVALNTAITSVKRQLFFIDANTLPDMSIEYESEMEMSEDIKLLYQAIGQLGKVEKAIILLWLEEKSYEEIAQAMGITIKNVSVKLVRIRTKLTTILSNLQ